MTIGQRIAQKRKEQGLSQEALGAALGVSRQAIYKWEADSTLPEIDKLIALSRLFGVSVGWLLGVEEASEAPDPSAPDQPELTEAQLQMVEEIAGRYIAALPAPKKRRKWPFLLAGTVLFFALFNLFDGLDQMQEQYERLQTVINRNLDTTIGQISGISGRVEEILKAQNDLTADYGTTLTYRSLQSNTVLFDVYAVPKTYVEGMTAQFCRDNGDGGVSYTEPVGALGEKFQSTVSAKLTDSIALSVVFTYPDGTRQTQLLAQYSGLYTESMPEVQLNDSLMWMKLEPSGTLTLTESSHERYVWLRPYEAVGAIVQTGPTGEPLNGPAAIGDVRVGLFKNQTLAAWAEPCDPPKSFHGFEDCAFYRLPALEVPLAPSDTVQIAAVVEDVYGRMSIQPNIPYCMDPEDLELTHPSGVMTLDRDMDNWTFQ